MKQELIIFDNHKIPRKFRGKTMVVTKDTYIPIGQYSSSESNPYTETWEYCSSGVESKSGRHIIKIEEDDLNKKNSMILYLNPKSYSLIPLKSVRTVEE